MSRTKGATNGKNKSRDEYLCYVVTKVDRFGAAIPNTSQTVYVPSTKELSIEYQVLQIDLLLKQFY